MSQLDGSDFPGVNVKGHAHRLDPLRGALHCAQYPDGLAIAQLCQTLRRQGEQLLTHVLGPHDSLAPQPRIYVVNDEDVTAPPWPQATTFLGVRFIWFIYGIGQLQKLKISQLARRA